MALHALVEEIVSQPLYDHVALAWSHGLLIYAKDESLVGFLYSDAARTLPNQQYVSVLQ